MKRLIYRLLCICLSALLLATQVAANMYVINSYRFVSAPTCSLTMSTVISANSASSSATLATSASVTAAVGDVLLAVVAADNAGTSGVSSTLNITPVSGNMWSDAGKINRTAGSASDGATLSFLWTKVTTALSSSTVTINFSPNTTSKAVQIYKLVPSASCYVTLVASDRTGSTGGAVTSHPAPSVSVTSGDTIFGAAAIEQGTPGVTGDSDTTNGSWSSVAYITGSTGTDATSMSSVSQYKTVTATGTQDWAATTTNTRDSARSYIIFRATSTPPPSILFVGCIDDTADQTTYTATSASLGPTYANRRILVLTSGRDGASTFTTSSLTVGGVATTELIDINVADIAGAAYITNSDPSGTTGNIVTTYSEAIAGMTACVWQLRDLTVFTPTNIVSVDNGSAGPNTIDLALDMGASGVAAAMCAAGYANPYEWLNFTEREDEEDVPPGTGSQWSAEADYSHGATASNAQALNCQKTSSGESNFGMALSFSNATVMTIAWTDTAMQNSASSSFSFPGEAIGAAQADRDILVAVVTGAGGDPTAVTVGGISGALVSGTKSGGANDTEFWLVPAVTSGTTATVAVTTGSSNNTVGIQLFRVTGRNGAEFDVATDITTSVSVTIDIPEGGVAAAVATHNSGTGVTFTGLTEGSGADTTFGGSNRFSAASDVFVAAETGHTVSTTQTGTVAMSVVSYGP